MAAPRFQGVSQRLGAIATASILQWLRQAASQYGFDPQLILSIAQRESGLDPNAVSSAGAKGIMQLMDATARALGVTNPFDPQQNIFAGVAYLAQLYRQFGDLVEAVAAYDWGPGNVSRALQQYGANWLAAAPAETQNYVQAILGVSAQDVAGSSSSSQASSTPPLTIDAATGLPIEDSTNVDNLAPAAGAPAASSSQNTLLIVAGLAAAAYLLAEEFDL